MIPIRSVLHGVATALVVASAGVAAGAGAAPWQWRDGQGRMVYSDRPPPKEVRAAQIVRSPAPGTAEASPAANAPAAAAANADPTSSAPTWVERERAFRERQARHAADEAKENEERENAGRTQRVCDDLQRTIRMLESGIVVASMNGQGEVEPLSDAERASRLSSAHAERDRACKPR